MPRTIFLRVGEKNRVPLAVFINALQDFLGMLRDLDATISKDQRGSVVWEVVSLRQRLRGHYTGNRTRLDSGASAFCSNGGTPCSLPASELRNSPQLRSRIGALRTTKTQRARRKNGRKRGVGGKAGPSPASRDQDDRVL